MKKQLLPNEKLLITPSREKYWKELGPLEKVERMRFMVKRNIEYQEHELSFLRNHINALLKHNHLDGYIVTKIETSNNTMGVIEGGLKRLDEKNNDEVYF